MILDLSFMHFLLVRLFELMYGLRVNMAKQWVVDTNMVDSTVNNLAEVIGCLILAWPIKYLGIQLGGNLRCKSFWDRVVSKVSRHSDN